MTKVVLRQPKQLNKTDFDKLSKNGKLYVTFLRQRFHVKFKPESKYPRMNFNKIRIWCEKNTSDLYYIDDRDDYYYVDFYFLSKNDAAAFKLRWQDAQVKDTCEYE